MILRSTMSDSLRRKLLKPWRGDFLLDVLLVVQLSPINATFESSWLFRLPISADTGSLTAGWSVSCKGLQIGKFDGVLGESSEMVRRRVLFSTIFMTWKFCFDGLTLFYDKSIILLLFGEWRMKVIWLIRLKTRNGQDYRQDWLLRVPVHERDTDVCQIFASNMWAVLAWPILMELWIESYPSKIGYSTAWKLDYY